VRDEIAEIDRRLHSNRRSLGDAARDLGSVQRQLDELTPDQQVRAWRRQLSAVEQRIEQAAEARTRHAPRQPPGYILTSIGGPPPDQPGQRRWVEAVRTVESYRVRFGITDQTHPLGQPGADPGQRDQRRATIRALTEALPHGRQLDHHPVRERSRSLGRGLTR
jgi:exonuclease VII large subunit